jgi:hypothetical protein
VLEPVGLRQEPRQNAWGLSAEPTFIIVIKLRPEVINTCLIFMSHRSRHDSRFVVVADNWSSGIGTQDVIDYLKKYQIHYLRR